MSAPTLHPLTRTAEAFDPSSAAALHERYHDTRDPALLDELVQLHGRLAVNLAHRFARGGESTDDLVQVAFIGLINAIKRFDPARGNQFSSFATPTIVGELKRHFRDKRWSLHVPRRVQELHLRVKDALDAQSQDLGRSPTVTEIAEYVGVAEEEVLEAMEAGRNFRALSLDATVDDDDDRPHAVQVGMLDAALAEAEVRQFVAPLVARLPAREQKLIHLRFVRNLTQAQIAEELGLSQMHVSRLLQRALEKLRAFAGPSLLG